MKGMESTFKNLKQGSVTNAFVLKSFDVCHRP